MVHILEIQLICFLYYVFVILDPIYVHVPIIYDMAGHDYYECYYIISWV